MTLTHATRGQIASLFSEIDRLREIEKLYGGAKESLRQHGILVPEHYLPTR